MNIFINNFKCQTVMYLLVLYFILLSCMTSSSASKLFTINKCCPKGKVISIDENRTFFCKNINLPDSGKSSTVEDFDYFPIHLIVNATTLKIHENHAEDYRKVLTENYEIKVGIHLNCSYDESGFGFADNTSSDFYFMLYENLTMKFHISKSDSKHKLEQSSVNFEKITDTAVPYSGPEILTFPISEACFDFTPNGTQIAYCRCLHNICLRKCCPEKHYMNISLDGYTCESLDDSPTEINEYRPQTEGIIEDYYLIDDSRPNCTLFPLKETSTCSHKYYSDYDNQFRILPNGSIKINRYKQLYSTEEYCGETTWHEEDGVIFEQNLFICNKNDQTKEAPSKARFIIYGTLLLFGALCLVVTVSISFYLPELRKRLHNKIALSHNFSLMVACFVGGISQLYKTEGDNCILLGSLTQFSFLGSFFWLNVMCIDISMTFSATRSVGDGSTSKEHKKFLYYSVYAWGSTAIITLVTIVMETLPRVVHYNLRPGFSCHCGFNTETSAVFIYFYGPMALILATNLILFVFTTIKIMAIQRQTAILHKTDFCATRKASYQSDKQRLILYAKLFLLMGLSWVTEILSWAIGGPEHYWYFTDAINLFRAVFIFILFICKRPVLTSLKRRLNGDFSTSKSESDRSSKDPTLNRMTTTAQSARFRPTPTNSSKKNLPRASKGNQNTRNTASTNANRFSESQI